MKLLLGNEAVAAGAIAGGVTFFAGYPLAATSEIHLAFFRSLQSPGAAVVAEDTDSAVAAALGAGAGGGLGATALAGPTLGAAEELVLYGTDFRIPALIAVLGGRSDFSERMESAEQGAASRLRLHRAGSPLPPVWVPASSADCYALAKAAAHEAVARSAPVLLYLDDVIAHLREPVLLPVGSGDAEATTADSPPSSPEPVELYRTRDATVIVVAFGIVARAARTAVRLAREQGLRAGLFRPVRLWPFPVAELEAAVGRERAILVAELNDGQVWEAIAARGSAGARGSVRSLAESREGMLTPARILAAIREAA